MDRRRNASGQGSRDPEKPRADAPAEGADQEPAQHEESASLSGGPSRAGCDDKETSSDGAEHQGGGADRDHKRGAANLPRIPALLEPTLTMEPDRGAPRGGEIADLADGELPIRDAGRYAIEGEHGRGGLGRVLLARDLELGRTIAIKEIRREGAADEQRFCREARITARLEHPGIVPVYDAGRWPGGKPFYSMKLVQGRSLKELLAATKTFNERLGLLAQVLAVAEAVAYAHSKGIIHRDLKPSNIIVGAYGETVVIDWGLAKELANRADGELGEGASEEVRAALPSLTGRGGVLGTPPFMPPEQAAGQPVDQRADVYALGAILYQVLTGQRPYEGASPDEVVARIQREAPAPVDELEPEIPAELAAIVAKAMARDPGERYPSAGEFGQDLRRYQTGKLVAAHRYTLRQRVFRAVRKHRPWIAAAALGGVALVALVRSIGPPLCQGGSEKLLGIWDDGVKQAIRASFAATGRSYANDTFERVARLLDRHTASWLAMRSEACEATFVRREQSDKLFDLRMQCLDRRLGELGALTDLFAHRADAAIVDKAVEASSQLSTLERCADTAALEAAYPPPENPATRSNVERLQKRLAEADALEKAGKYREGSEIVREVAAQAEGLNYPPLMAEERLLRGRFLHQLGDAKGAEPVLYEAARLAAKAKDDTRVAEAWTELVWVVGARQARDDDAMALRPIAETAIARAGGEKLLHARLLSWLGIVVLQSHGEHDKARRHFERALAIQESALGPDHPGMARTVMYLGLVFHEQGKHAEARRQHERALAIFEKALGPDHPETAKAVHNLAQVFRLQGKHAEARGRYERALAIFENALGSDHPNVAMILGNLGLLFQGQGKYAEARPYHDRALATLEKALGPEHPAVATALEHIGELLYHQRRFRQAQDYLERSFAIYEKALPRDHPDLAYPLTVIGEIELERRRPAAALAPLERALTIRQSTDVSGLFLAATQFALARALWDSKRDRTRAIALATHARDIYASLGEGLKKELADVKQWLATRSPQPGK